MTQQQPASDPFAFMMNPAAVIQAMEKSERLNTLKRRICRPLDKPLIARTAPTVEVDDCDDELEASSDTDDFDNEFDASPESDDLGSAIDAMRASDEG
ncbi:MAG: hypothetical protein OEM00_00775 [Burkholderiaceae bacterium]|nr:hypothetical protein [Burkholderiaceae bacterium]MDH3459517.1 hypothetical protein [Burkholderiaceae bacterium]